jgi:hypothetical protein
MIGVGAAAALALSRPWRTLVEIATLSSAERLSRLITHRESARVVGDAYLDAVPEEASAAVLVDRVTAGLPGGRRAVHDAGDDRLRELLASRIRADFAEDRVVDLRGWVLSPTEARLCALTTLA